MPSTFQSEKGYAVNLNSFFGCKDMELIRADHAGKLLIWRCEGELLTYAVWTPEMGKWTIRYPNKL